MSKDGPSTAEAVRFLRGPFIWLTRLILAFPVATIAIAVGLAIAAPILQRDASSAISTSRLDLLNPKSDYNRLGSNTSRSSATKTTRWSWSKARLATRSCRCSKSFRQLWPARTGCFTPCCTKSTWARFAPKVCTICRPTSCCGIDQFLDEARPIVDGDWSPLGLGNLAPA